MLAVQRVEVYAYSVSSRRSRKGEALTTVSPVTTSVGRPVSSPTLARLSEATSENALLSRASNRWLSFGRQVSSVRSIGSERAPAKPGRSRL